jgi:signal transduction histidine kinase
VLSLFDTGTHEETREAARALVQHLRDARELLRRAAVRLSPAVEADLLDASAELTAELRQRRGAKSA